jgi:hypothetical protein
MASADILPPGGAGGGGIFSIYRSLQGTRKSRNILPGKEENGRYLRKTWRTTKKDFGQTAGGRVIHDEKHGR